MNPNENPYGLSRLPLPPAAPAHEEVPVPAPVFAQPSAALPMPMVDRRARTAGIAILVSAAVLLVGIIARSWFTGRGGTLSLLGLEECRGMVCQSMNWFDIKRAPTELKLFSSIGLLGSVVAIGFMIHAGVVLLKNAASRVKLMALNISLGLAAFGCVSFFFHLTFGELSRRVSMSWAGVFAIGAIIAAGVIVPTMIRPLMRAPRQ